MRKLMILIWMLLCIICFSEENEVVKNKLVIDYGNFLSIESQKSIHKKLEEIYNITGVYLSIVTLKNEDKYNITKSITDYIKELKKIKINDAIILVRTDKKYNIYLFGGAKNKEIKNMLDQIINEYIELQEQIQYFNVEIELITDIIGAPENLKLLQKYNNETVSKERNKTIIIISAILTGIISLILLIYFIRRRVYLKKIGALI